MKRIYKCESTTPSKVILFIIIDNKISVNKLNYFLLSILQDGAPEQTTGYSG